MSGLFEGEPRAKEFGLSGLLYVNRPNPVALVAGTVTVADANVTANTQIRLYSSALGGAPGALYISAKSAGVSYTISSTNGADTSTVVAEIVAY